MNDNNTLATIASKILVIRGMAVILDYEIANLYKVKTFVLKQSVKRNIERFPSDFMFELNDKEIQSLVSQNVIPSYSKLGGSRPYAFTEEGVAMLYDQQLALILEAMQKLAEIDESPKRQIGFKID